MDKSLSVRIADVPVTTVKGTWLRHAFAAYPERALDGRVYDGRWGTRSGFPVLYLGNPLDSVIVEAYRHLVDPVESPDMLLHIHPRILVTAEVDVTDVLDLRIQHSHGARRLRNARDRASAVSFELLRNRAEQRRPIRGRAPSGCGIHRPPSRPTRSVLDRLPAHASPARLKTSPIVAVIGVTNGFRREACIDLRGSALT